LNPGMEELLGRWCSGMESRGLDRKTVRRRRKAVSDFLGRMKIGSPLDIFPENLEAYGKIVVREKRSVSSQRFALSAVRLFLRYLLRTGHLLFDAAIAMDLPGMKRPLPRTILSEEEMKALFALPILKSREHTRLRAIVELLYGTAVRRSELRNLDRYDVDIPARTVLVRAGKGGKDRVLPLPRRAARAVKYYMEDIGEGRRDGALILGPKGRRIAPRRIAEELRELEREARELAGITKHITCHVFRHSIATHLLRRGVDIRYIQVFLGHEKLMTTQIYTRVAVMVLVREVRRTHPRDMMDVPLA